MVSATIEDYLGDEEVGLEWQNHWAVIVAGSRGYGNYRHHADAFHAYYIMRDKGIPKENIIMMVYDDVVQDKANPFPGKIFNKPTKAGEPGKDYYNGSKENIDYKGKNATLENFLALFTGNETATGPVLKSNGNSKIFFQFFDHGAPGLVAMPDGKRLTAVELLNATKALHDRNMYSQMVFYIEACESGSMFHNFTAEYADLNVYAVSAANSSQSSWGTYCHPYDMVDGKTMHTCLGDLFSVSWMEDTDSHPMGETLHQQFDTVREETNKSHVLQWGKVSMDAESIYDF